MTLGIRDNKDRAFLKVIRAITTEIQVYRFKFLFYSQNSSLLQLN